MTYTQQREVFITQYSRMALSAAVLVALDEARYLMRFASRLGRINVKQCNDPAWSDKDYAERERVQGRVCKLVEPYGIIPEFQNDPRGPSIRLSLGHHQDGSYRYTVAVPERG